MMALESSESYTIGWIAPLPIERAAATALLDDRHEQPEEFEQHSSDANSYTWGRMGKHHIVIASLPAGISGIISAAVVASSLLTSLPNIRIGLLVGIGSAIIRPDLDIRLGDVVVSQPSGTTGGVIQYDIGNAKPTEELELKSSLNKPPSVLLNALSTLKAEHEVAPSRIPDLLSEMWKAHPHMKTPKKKESAYVHQGIDNDQLFFPSYSHQTGHACDACDPSKEVKRDNRGTIDPYVYYGTIASGNSVIQDSYIRDKIALFLGKECICIDTEAAGLMDHFPCLVIRGICDYADSHSSDRWQRYAAATAAAYTKELLAFVPIRQLQNTDRAVNILKSLSERMKEVQLKTTKNLDISLGIKEETSQIPKVQSTVEFLQSVKQREETERITNWLAPITFAKTQVDIYDIAQDGTGQWFVNGTAFRDWITALGTTLWCPGIAGAGKTVLMSVAVAWLLEYAQNRPGIKVASAYCDYKNKDTHDIMNIIMGLWRQLIDPDTEHTTDVQKLWNEHRRAPIRGGKQTEGDRVEIIKAVIDRSSQTFLIIDALDELPANLRPRLLGILRYLQGSGRCNIMVTSRYYQSIAELFKNDARQEISAQWDDLLLYIKARSQDEPFQILRSRVSMLEDKIVETVIPKCQSMFLLAKLYMERLVDAASSVKGFKAAMTSLPEGLYKAYDDAMERIVSDQANTASAMRILFWVAFSTRPLSIKELIHALAVELGDTEYDSDNELLGDMTSMCAALVVIDSTRSTVRLAHYTAEQYLKQSYEKWFPDIFTYMTSRMLTYLSFKTFQKPLEEGGVTMEDVCQDFPFLQYATLNWATHLAKVPDSSIDEVFTQVLEFLYQEFRLSDRLIKSHTKNIIETCRFEGEPYGNVTGLHLAVLFNISSAVPLLLAHEQAHPNEKPLLVSPLNLAATMNRVEITRQLLEDGADVHGAPGFPWRPIHQAARFAGVEVVGMLLDHGADIEAKVTVDAGDPLFYYFVDGQTPLYEAARFENIDVVKLLLARGADMFQQAGTFDNTPLSCCYRNTVFPYLISTLEGAQILDKRVIWPLIQSRSAESLKSIIKRGFDVNQLCHYRKSALDYALLIGDDEVITVLLENGAVPSHQWISEETMLKFSTKSWFPGLINALLNCEFTLEGDEGRGYGFDNKRWDPPLLIDTNTPINPNVEVLISDDVELPIQLIVFKTDSHDQGWSDFDSDHGSYRNSQTWFEMRIKNPALIDPHGTILGSSNSDYSNTVRVQFNVHASDSWKKHINIWDRNSAPPDILSMLNQIGKGSTVEFIARAVYPGWLNYVRFMKVDVYDQKVEYA